MENGTNTGKFSNCISCISRSGDKFCFVVLVDWPNFKETISVHIYFSLKNQTIFSVELFIITIAVIFGK